MDPARFDTLVKTLSTTGTRRSLLHLLSALPVAGAIAALLGDEGAARSRRKKRKDRHRQDQTHRQQRRRHAAQHRQQQDQQQRKKQRTPKDPTPEPGCQPASKAQTCTGQCAGVTDNCGRLVDCGACACDPLCGECLTCDPATGACIPDDTQEEDPCGQPGQVCQTDGACVCSGSSCGTCRTCQGDGACSSVCNGTGCCDGTDCKPGTANGDCGTGGGDCMSCSGATPLCVSNACAACSSSGECAAAGLGNRCCGGACVTGDCCSSTECANPTPACANNTCAACSAAPNGTPCGTQSEPRGGTIRCYDGACPDPDCVPSGLTGTPCSGCSGLSCCAQGTICQGGNGPPQCFCFFAREEGGKCGSDHDCSRMRTPTVCIGGTCQTPP